MNSTQPTYRSKVNNPCDNHPDVVEFVICKRKDKVMHLCYECYQELLNNERKDK